MRELHELIRENSGSESEYQRYVQSMKASILSAFYTPDHIVKAIGTALAGAGAVPQRMLDPSAGTGIFPDYFGKPNGTTQTVCIEQDALTAKVLSALYPEHQVINDGFQSVGTAMDGQFDVVASNIPFGNFRVFDSGFDRSKDSVRSGSQSTVHGYFFVKGVDALREGGVLTFVTTRGIMDSPGNKPLREWLMQNCDLLSAVRLPDETFRDNAGTDVGADVIVLQKRSDKTALAPHEQAFVSTIIDAGAAINSTFEHGKNSVSTAMRVGKDHYGKPAFEFRFSGTTDEMEQRLTDMLAADLGRRFDKEHYNEEVTAPEQNDVAAQILDEDDAKQEDLDEETAKQEDEPAEPLYQEPEVASYVCYASVSDWREPGYLANMAAKKARQDNPDVQSQNNNSAAQPQNIPTPTQQSQNTLTSPSPARIPNRNLRQRGKVKLSSSSQLDLFARAVAPERATIEQASIQPQVDTTQHKASEPTQTTPQQEPTSVTAQQSAPATPPSTAPRPYEKEFAAHYREGTVVEDGGQIGALIWQRTGDVIFSPLDLKPNQQARLQKYIVLRDLSHQLYETEAALREPQDDLRAQVNAVYDDFTQAFGSLNSKENTKLILLDPSGVEVLALERWEDGQPRKADIMHHPVAFAADESTSVESVEEALAASLNKFGTVNLSHMEQLCGTPAADMIEQLQGRIFFNPVGGQWEIKDKFISGNVIEKIRQIEAVPRDQHAENALAALKASIPERITYEELTFNFGERWIPAGVYGRFASWLFNADVSIKYSNRLDAFDVQCMAHNAKIGTEYMVRGEGRRYNGIDLMEHALVNTIPDITKTIRDDNGEWVKVRDGEKIQMADTLITKIRNEFTDWLDRQNPDFKQRLCDIYNDKFNCFVKPKYDGSHQEFPGLDMAALKCHFNVDEIYVSQKDVVWMLKQNGGGVCDHEVGTGKTLTMCIAAMEMKRLGLAHKPLIIGLKANAKEIARTMRVAYPKARVIYPSENDFTPKNRVRLLNDIKNNDWDCVVLTHDQFSRIPQSQQVQQKIYEDEINDIEENLEVLKRGEGRVSGWILKGLEVRKRGAEAKLSKLQADMNERRDDVADFATMGIDHIFVDESHQFKNLMFNTRHGRVAGLGNAAGSQRAANLLFAIRTIQERTGRDLGATFLSGTTISNSLTELYLIFKYLRPRALEKQEINCFDAWAAVFAKKSTEYEFSVTNQIIQKERFRHFIKVPELANFYNEITDYRTAEDIGIDRPDLDQSLLALPPSDDQVAYLARLVEFAGGGRASLIGHRELSEREETARMLLATNYSNKMSLDMRLIDSEGYGDHPHNKATECARRIAEYYHKYDAQKGTQMVFSDLSVHNPNQWNIYSEIKRKLVEDHGIPAHEVRFIQESTTEARREKMIEAMNEGQIRVLFGSTQKLGTGVNAQRRVVAMHHLDIPWTPKDLRQRTGRGQRKGNIVAKEHAGNVVRSFVYATERSLDSYKFGILTNKQLFIDQIKRGTLGVRNIDEGAMSEDGGISYAEMAAITSGNTDLLELAKLDKKIAMLESERSAFVRGKADAKYNLDTAQTTISYHEGLLVTYNRDIECRNKLTLQDSSGTHTCAHLQVDGALNKSPRAMADRLHQIEKQARTEGGYDRVGTLGEFNIFVRTEQFYDNDRVVFSNSFSVGGWGKVKYTHNNGKLPQDNALAVVSFAKALDKIEGLADNSKKTLAKLAADIPTLQKVAESPFAKELELQAMRVERDVLDRKINLSIKPVSEPLAAHEEIKEQVEERYGDRTPLDGRIIVCSSPPFQPARKI